MGKISKKQFIEGAFWKVLEKVASKSVGFIVSLILARLLTPGDYGIIAITTIFTSLSDILIDSGFSTTLIRKKEVDKYDYGSAFIASAVIACVLYMLIFFCAPGIASFYNESILKDVLRVIGLVLFIQALASTRNVVVYRNMQFKLLVMCNMLGSIISGLLGIIAAVADLGVWALVIQQLSQQVIATTLLFVKLHWRFSWNFQWKRFKEISSFSIGVMGASLLNFIGASLYGMAIGKCYSVTALGYYNKGEQLPKQASLYTFEAMSSVLLPALSSYQDDKQSFKRILRKVVTMTAYLVFPMMLGMAVVSRELIIILLTDKWLPALRIMQYACIYYIATPFMLINVQVFYALGHSFIRVRTEIVRTVLLLLSLVIFSLILRCSIATLMLISAVIMIINTIDTYREVYKLVHYKIEEILKDTIKPCFFSVLMGVSVFGLNILVQYWGMESDLLRLGFDFFAGAVIYLLFSIVFKIDGYLELKQLIFRRKHRNE